MTDIQRSTSVSASDLSEDEKTRIARETAMIEAARAEVRDGFTISEDRFEQWFEQILRETGRTEPTTI